MKIANSRMTILFIFCFFSVTQSANVLAKPSGITGYSGAYGLICSPCHGGGAPAITVTLEADSGSNTVVAGSTGSFTLALAGGSTRAGMNVAVTDGSLISTVPRTKTLNNELIHSSPLSLTSGEGSWTFDWRAPDQDGTYTIYAAVLSTNGKDDRTETATLSITVEPAPDSTQPAANNPSSSGGGGCTINARASFDPLIPLLTTICCLYLFLNRKRRIKRNSRNTFN